MNSLKLLLGALAFYGRFLPSFTAIGFHVRRLAWPRFRPDFDGQRWVVTGASAGIGREIALAAARAGAAVTAVARPSAKLEALLALARIEGLKLEIAPVDLSLMADIDRWVVARREHGKPVEVLVNNAGVMLDDHSLTSEGHETSFATNLLGHFRLTEGLLAAGLLPADALVLNMTSGGAYHVPLVVAPLDMKNPGHYNGTHAYAFHKRAQVVLSEHWRLAWASTGRRCYVMHPGWVDTDGVKRSLPRFRAALRAILRDEAAGADTALWLAATRPVQPAGEHIWFDRKPRPAHVSARTKQSKDGADSLVRALAAA